MKSSKPGKCAKCLRDIKAGEAYAHYSKTLCEACYMDVRTPLARKTHWQYLRSIKNEYLRPAEGDLKNKTQKGASQK